MGGLDKVEKSLIVALVVSVVATLFLAGFSIYSYWYAGTHHDYGTETVRTGDVTWATPRQEAIWMEHNGITRGD